MPSNSEILSALGTGGNCLRTHKSLQPLKRPNGEYYFSTGNFSLVVKMNDTATGKYYAMKCFTKLHPKLIDSYALIGKHIQLNQSPYLVHYEFCENEIWVSSELDGKKGYPVVIMEWIEGKTLGCYLAELVDNDDKDALFQLACRFDAMSLWLLEQPFAHGDLKTDNILVDPSGRLRLIDYDGMFTPEMQNQHARENGSPGFRHPKRLQEHFGPHIDDFSILIISLSLHALASNPSLAGKDNSFSDSILFTEDGLCKPEHSTWQLFETLRDNSHVAQRLVMLQMAAGNPATMRLFGIKPILKGTASLAPLKTYNEEINIEMVFVNGGTFQMGSNDGYYNNEKPVHTVTVSDFYMGKFEITQAQWKAVMGNSPSEFEGDNLPVDTVSWIVVQEFIKKLNEKTCKSYRLPTEAEWEYVAHGGNKSSGFIYSGSNTLSDVAWYTESSIKTSHVVGSKQPNELGIYDMSGNIYEWCNDWFGDYKSNTQTNPTGPSTGSHRVIRGGCWCCCAQGCRIAFRGYNYPDNTFAKSYGFRLALTVPSFITDNNEIPNEDIEEFSVFKVDLKTLYYGFKQKSTGKIICDAIFKYIDNFSDGLAKVTLDYKIGFINKMGNVVIPLINTYDKVNSFTEGLARVTLNNKNGFINKTGKVIIPLIYNYADNFSEGLAKVKLKDKYGFIDKTGKVIIPLIYDSTKYFSESIMCVELNGRSGFIGKTGKVIIPFIYDRGSDFSEGLVCVGLNWKWGWIDKTGKIVIPLIYNCGDDFTDGLANVKLKDKYGWIDKSGKVIIPLIYDKTEDFSEGLSKVKSNRKWGWIDKSGKVIIPLIYDDANNFRDEMCRVNLNGKWGWINTTGKVIIPFIYDVSCDFLEGFAMVKLNGKWGWIDNLGKVTIPLIYDEAWAFREEMSRVNLNGKWGWINTTGKVIIPFIYDEVLPFTEDLCKVNLNGKEGFIDRTGNVIIPLIYDKASDFSRGLIIVTLKGKSGFIYKRGSVMWD